MKQALALAVLGLAGAGAAYQDTVQLAVQLGGWAEHQGGEGGQAGVQLGGRAKRGEGLVGGKVSGGKEGRRVGR